MPEVEIGDDTGADKESWEGLGAEDKENMNKDKGKNEGEDGEEDSVSATLS